MQEHDSSVKDNFVMSGKRSGSDEREDAFEYSGTQERASRKPIKPFLLAGAGVILVIIVILMFMSGSPRSGEKDQIKSIENRLKSIEEKLAKLEWIDTGLARLDSKEKEIASTSERILQMEAALNKKADQIAREAAKPAPKPAETHPPQKVETHPQKVEAAPPKPAPAQAKADKTPKPKVHVVQKGETIFGISRKYGIPADQLMKLNKIDQKNPIKPGQELVLGAPKNN
jgi:LysM repeat protein